MKRDMDLVRDILLAIEAEPLGVTGYFNIEGKNQRVVEAHVKLLKDAGYLASEKAAMLAGGRMERDLTLTWAGHEFLETIRDPKIWEATKSNAKQVGNWSLSLLAELAKGLIRQKAIDLGFPLG